MSRVRVSPDAMLLLSRCEDTVVQAALEMLEASLVFFGPGEKEGTGCVVLLLST